MNSRSETSCHFSLSWRCRKIQGWGWLAGAGVPTHPVEKDREIRIQLTVWHFQCLAPWNESFYTVYHIFLFLPKHTQVGKTKSILHDRAATGECGQVDMLNRSFRPWAIYHDSSGVTLVCCSTMWFLLAELDKLKWPRQPNSLTEIVKPLRQNRESFKTCLING